MRAIKTYRKVGAFYIAWEADFSTPIRLGLIFEVQVVIVIAASRTPLWLPSGWGCPGRRLSKARRNPDTQRGLSRCRPAMRRRERDRDGQVQRGGSWQR